MSKAYTVELELAEALFRLSLANLTYEQAKMIAKEAVLELNIKHDPFYNNDEQKKRFVERFVEGFKEGVEDTVFSSVQEGDYEVERGAQKLGISVEEFKERMNDYVNSK